MYYKVIPFDQREAHGIYEGYDILVGPNNFECILTEPEDRNWGRDGKKVVAELNRLAQENTDLKAELSKARDICLVTDLRNDEE